MHLALVGGGVIGLAAATRLARDGHDVTILEKGSLGAETTSRSAAVFMWQEPYPSRFGFDLRGRSWETYGPLVDDGRLSHNRVGALYVAESTDLAADFRAAAATLREWGHEAEYLDAVDLPKHGVEPDGYEGGLYSPGEGYFDPTEVVDCFAEDAREAGVDIREGTTVTDLRWDGDRVVGVETDDGDVEADYVVNAAGPWSPQLNAMADVSLPLKHTYGPILVLNGDPGPLPFTMFEAKQYLRPLGNGGAYAGRYATAYDDGERLDPDASYEPDDAFRDEISELLDRITPLGEFEIREEWVGLRTVTPDGLPTVGHTSTPGFLVACGMNGLGVTLAPVVADVLANAVADEEDEARRGLRSDRF